MNGDLAPESLAVFRTEIAEDPEIMLIDATMKREDVLGLIAASDCVVSLHRSEGFGLLVAEAMLLGKPVVATNYSATTELVSPETGFPVGYRLVPVAAGEYPFAEGQVWADPDVAHAAWQMARIFSEPTGELVRAAVLRAYEAVRRRHGRDQVAIRQADRISRFGNGRA
jgi:glycosyltransferase involved in cell wall biosynthesis